MSALVPVALFGWPLVALFVFALLPPLRAVLTTLVLGWLFLPEAGFALSGLPDFDKSTATIGAVLLGAAVYDRDRLLTFRPTTFDLPMAVFCIAPLASSVANGLGLYDGFSAVLDQLVHWGLPYLVGRVYLRTAQPLQALALAIFIGGLVYAPLCLWEVRMAPTLHQDVYGFHQSPFVHTHRFGGYRPKVFLHSGLAVGMWMSAACVMGFALWRYARQTHWQGLPMVALLAFVALTTVLCKSTGALLLGLGAAAILALAYWLRRRWPVLLLAVAPLIYIGMALTNTLPRELGIELARQVGEDRAASFQSRMEQEAILVERGLQRPWLGWGGWGRYRAIDEFTGEDVSVTDGMWVLTFGRYGLLGVAGFALALL
ncbi:MAG: O-antigen ligase domain-containing protein, partial [Parvularculaceae bacterium]|nr:O-antigen ligase domain-containing protein [Parvularculaceae bacterium]